MTAHTSSADRSIVISARASPIGRLLGAGLGVAATWRDTVVGQVEGLAETRSPCRHPPNCSTSPARSPSSPAAAAASAARCRSRCRGRGRRGRRREPQARELREHRGRDHRGDRATRAVPMAVNVSHWDQCDELVERVYAEFGHCDVLINNAGLSPLYPDLAVGHRGALRQDPRGQRQGPVPAGHADRHAHVRGRRRLDHQRVDRRLVATRRARPAVRDGEGGAQRADARARRRVQPEGARQHGAARARSRPTSPRPGAKAPSTWSTRATRCGASVSPTTWPGCACSSPATRPAT